jgi:hypothetical protein
MKLVLAQKVSVSVLLVAIVLRAAAAVMMLVLKTKHS